MAGAQMSHWLALCIPFSHALDVIGPVTYGIFCGVRAAVVTGVEPLAGRGDTSLMGAIGQIRRD